jgi:integrase
MSLGRVSLAFERTGQRARLTNARFHDLRHTFVTHARRAKIDYLRIMAITGQKTLRVFQRYNLIDEGDLQDMMTTLQTSLAHHDMDTSMDTSALEGLPPRRQDAVNPRR